MQSNADDNQTRHAERLIILAARASVAVAFTLLLFKLWAWFATGSMGVLAGLVDSLLDLGASLINMFAVRYAMIPPDDEHRFGHGKAEALAGLGQSAFIASSALFLIIYTVERIVHPEMIESVDIGSGVIVLSMVMTLFLVIYQRHVVRQTGSVAIRADSLHFASDLITNGGILIGLVLYNAGWLYSDPVIAMLIGFYILKCSIHIGHESIQLLLDRELPEEEQELVRKLALAHPDVLSVHDVRTRQSGRTKFIQLHLVLNGRLSLIEAHALSDLVEAEIHAAFDDVDIIIHQDPHTESDSRIRYPE